MPDIASAVIKGMQFKFVGGGAGHRLVKQHQPDPRGVAAEDSKVGPLGGDGCAQGQRLAGGRVDEWDQLRMSSRNPRWVAHSLYPTLC